MPTGKCQISVAWPPGGPSPLKHQDPRLLSSASTPLTPSVDAPTAPSCTVLLLHGRDMHPDQLQPFADLLGPGVAVQLPAGPVRQADGQRAWWPVDPVLRATGLAQGPMDLAQRCPAGRDPGHRVLAQAIAQAQAAWPQRPVVLAGFSQGGMLALDHLLCADPVPPVAGLALLSASRLGVPAWADRLHRLAGLPVLVAHGRQDAELAFSAGEGLRDLMAAAGAELIWLPFEDGHGLPPVVWRGLRRWLGRWACPGSPA